MSRTRLNSKNTAPSSQRLYTYFRTRQGVEEVNPQTGASVTNYFMKKQLHERVIVSGNTTVVILDDGSKGIARCGHKDKFDPTVGKKVAYLRAKIESLQKELAQYLPPNKD